MLVTCNGSLKVSRKGTFRQLPKLSQMLCVHPFLIETTESTFRNPEKNREYIFRSRCGIKVNQEPLYIHGDGLFSHI